MYVTSREVKNTKYVANFHTKTAADEYETYLKNLLGVERELVGVTRVRNSVVYTMECFKRGHTLAKQFEDDYVAKMTPKTVPTPASIPEPVAVQPEPTPEPIAEPIAEPITEPIPEILQVFVEELVTEAEPEAELADDVLEEITEEELAQAVEEFVEDTSVLEEPKPTEPGPITSKITGFFKGSNKINTN